MKRILFISDLHLHESRPQITQRFTHFLEKDAPEAQALYILGDFFEVWPGDDDNNDHNRQVIRSLKQFTQTNIPLYFMRGNRDFLIGEKFAEETGCILIPDPFVIDLFGIPTLLMHGDSLCTLDVRHQRFRRFSQHPFIRSCFLKFPLAWRRKIATGTRAKSKRILAQQAKIDALTQSTDPRYEVTQIAVITALNHAKTTVLIHGHTHKAGMHEFQMNAQACKRIVLGEWGALGSVLVCTEQEQELQSY